MRPVKEGWVRQGGGLGFQSQPDQVTVRLAAAAYEKQEPWAVHALKMFINRLCRGDTECLQ